MKTVKMSVKEMKALNKFQAVSATGKLASFEVQGESALNLDSDKLVKLDSLRKSWEVVVEEPKGVDVPLETIEADIEMEESMDEELISQGINLESEVEVAAESQLDDQVEQQVDLNQYVITPDEGVGYVVDIYKGLATVETVIDGNLSEEGYQVDKLTLADKEEHAKEIKKLEALRTPAPAKVEKEEKAPKSKPERTKAPVTDDVTLPHLEYVGSEYSETGKNFKLVAEVAIDGLNVKITGYNGFTQDVRVLQYDVNDAGEVSEELLYKSPKYSVKDVLVNYFKFNDAQTKAMSKLISAYRKEELKNHKGE